MSTFLGWALDRTAEESPLIEPRLRVEDGRPVERPAVIAPYESVPHELDVGATGGGKSTLLRVGAVDLVQAAFSEQQQLKHEVPNPTERERLQSKIIICDGKGGNSFAFLTGQPGIVALPNGPDAITEAIMSVIAETHRRYEEYDRARHQAQETRRAPDYAAPGWLHLWIDEWMSYILQLPGGREDGGRDQVLNALITGGQIAREVRVRFRFATQRPDARSVDVGLPGLLKAQLKIRTAAAGVMGMDGIEAWMAFDERDYADTIRAELGAGFAKVGRFEHHYRIPWVPDPTDPDPGITQEERDGVWALLPYDTTLMHNSSSSSQETAPDLGPDWTPPFGGRPIGEPTPTGDPQADHGHGDDDH